jgi:hypothetical protein
MPRGVYDRTKTKVKRSTSKATEDYRLEAIVTELKTTKLWAVM